MLICMCIEKKGNGRLRVSLRKKLFAKKTFRIFQHITLLRRENLRADA